MREEQVIGKLQQRRSRGEAEQLVEAFEASGLRRREFCQQHDVALGTLDLWRNGGAGTGGAWPRNPRRKIVTGISRRAARK